MKTPAILLILFIAINISAQNPGITQQEYSITIGMGEMYVDKTFSGTDLDFINYVDADPDYTDFINIKFGYKLEFLSKFTGDFKLIMMDDIIPDNYDISIHYYIKPWWGIGAGSMLNKNYITSFEQYHLQTYPDYYMSQNTMQMKVYDLGFYVSPSFKYTLGQRFKLLFKFDMGLSAFNKHESVFKQKKKYSNERVVYKYNTKNTYQPYVQPKAELRFVVANVSGAEMGLIFNSNYFYSNRRIDYKRTTSVWTYNNPTIENIKPPKHNYTRFEFDFGVFVSW